MTASDATQSVGNNTDNPQEVNGVNASSSDASLFQQSAGTESLNQNKELQVAQTGQPVTTAKRQNNSAATIIFVVIASVVLIMIASSVFKWVMKRPEPTEADKAEADAAVNKPTFEVIRPGKKKLSRSHRHK